jgi:hypothetical protein
MSEAIRARLIKRSPQQPAIRARLESRYFTPHKIRLIYIASSLAAERGTTQIASSLWT